MYNIYWQYTGCKNKLLMSLNLAGTFLFILTFPKIFQKYIFYSNIVKIENSKMIEVF